MEYSAQKGYKNLDVSDEAKRKNSRTKILVGGSLLTIIVTISVIIGVVLHQKSQVEDDTIHGGGSDPSNPDIVPDPTPDDPTVDGHHPMLDIYGEMPDFSAIGTNDGTDEEMKTDFWEDKWFGKALYEPLYKWDAELDADGNPVLDADGNEIIVSNDVDNALKTDLDNEWANRGEEGTYGYFKLKNIQSTVNSNGALGKFFVDFDFFATNLTNTTYSELVDLNNTQATAGNKRDWDDYKEYVNGYGRLVFYKQMGPNYFPDTNQFNPNDPENIQVYKVYETYLENGLGNKDPMYGRVFEHEKNCLVGFLSYDTNPMKPCLEGKGFLITQNADSVKEGLWTTSIDTEPTTVVAVNNLIVNELAN